jgi:alkylhydroperoxidase family enzyme
MILLQWVRRVCQRLARPASSRVPGARVLPAYAALGRQFAGDARLDPRLRLLVGQLAAELSGCRWCIEYGRHRWHQAFFSTTELRALRRHSSTRRFSARERAALAFTEALSRYADALGGIPEPVLLELRRHFSEPEVAALTLLVAEGHFFNAATGALGADAQSTPSPRNAAGTPVGRRGWRAPGSGVRNLW